MKCVGAEDGTRPCQRCKRANTECVFFSPPCPPLLLILAARCIFEKHRRGRKPGSKYVRSRVLHPFPSLIPASLRLSEASKMLRRLEKGLNASSKLRPNSAEAASTPYPPPDMHGHPPMPPADAYTTLPPPDTRPYTSSSPPPPPPSAPTHYPPQLAPLNLPPYQNGEPYGSASNGARPVDPDDDDDDDGDKNEESFFPAKLIKRENQRNSFFRTILNPEEAPARSPSQPGSSTALNNPRVQPTPPGPVDPIASKILTEEDAKMLFDLLFLRLNPFINLFDPALHTAPYVRSKCPFLFTTLLMVCCKFWRPNLFKETQKLATQFAVQAFADAWKRVEVVQAFACLTYWKDPDDNVRSSTLSTAPFFQLTPFVPQRTWTYIGYVRQDYHLARIYLLISFHRLTGMPYGR